MKEMRRAADKDGEQINMQYSRYLDDMTISSSWPAIPRRVRNALRRNIGKNGWTVHPGKLEYIPMEGRRKLPVVTGLVVHEDGNLTLPRASINRYRATYDHILKADEVTEMDRQEVRGIIGFVNMVCQGTPPSRIRQLHHQCMKRFGADRTGGQEARPRRSPPRP